MKVHGAHMRCASGPSTCDLQASPEQEWQHKSLVCCVAQESSEEQSNTEREEEVIVEERLEGVDLGSNPQEPRPISISSKLLE